jgi:hypothetical protein
VAYRGYLEPGAGVWEVHLGFLEGVWEEASFHHQSEEVLREAAGMTEDCSSGNAYQEQEQETWMSSDASCNP